MLFYWFDKRESHFEDDPVNEAWRLARWWRWLLVLFCGAGGLLYAAALPPLNLSFCAFFALFPLFFFITMERRWRWVALAGWFWGWCWAICSYRFLREIEWFVPWLLAPVIALFPAVWAVCVAYIISPLVYPPKVDAHGIFDRKEYLLKGPRFLRMVLLGVATAAVFVAVEFSRSRLFVWNDLSVTLYRYPALIQTSALTGSYGVTFAIVLVNTALWVLLLFRKSLYAAITLFLFAAFIFLGGWIYVNFARANTSQTQWNILAIQGDLSQRRQASLAQVAEAIDVYGKLTREALDKHPEADVVIWPESAIPILYFSQIDFRNQRLSGTGLFYYKYKQLIYSICNDYNKQMIFGALDAAESPPWTKGDIAVTNSALLTDINGRIISRYDKYHRVPYGEYIPGRNLLPAWLIDKIDMGRDLVPGNRLYPMEIPLQGSRAGRVARPGIVICYEGVFSYVTRGHMLAGANMLLALSNDAWYPVSSEPEQHLANATLRAIECGVPMVRCGNNGGTGVVMPDGTFKQVLEVSGSEKRLELRRGRGYKLLKVPFEENLCATFFVRFGDWFPWLATAFSAVILFYAYRRKFTVIKISIKETELKLKNLEDFI